MEVKIYLKYKWSGNLRGAGKAAGIIEYLDKKGEAHIKVLKEQTRYDTKNALEIKACLTALRALKKKCNVTIYTNCRYIENGYEKGWMKEWKENGWKRKGNKELANAKEWQLFQSMTEIHNITLKSYEKKYDELLVDILKEEDKWQKE